MAGVGVAEPGKPAWRVVSSGVLALPEPFEAALFLLGDQPFVSPELIRSLVQKYLENSPPILAPFVGGRRANPVLFDRHMFGALCMLQGDAGGRSLFKDHPPAPLPWPDERLLLDLDTPDDYRRLLEADTDRS